MTPMLLRGSLIIVFCAACVSGAPQRSGPADQSCFADEGHRQAGFVEFRERLLSAVRSRDWTALQLLVHPQVFVERDTARGVQTFAELFDFRSPSSPSWALLERILTIGGRFTSDEEFCAPFVSCPIAGDLDPADEFVVARNVVVRAEPRSESRELGRVSCEPVRVVADTAPVAGWVKLAFDETRTGFVDSGVLWNPFNYRAVFRRSDGQWKLAALVAAR